MNFERTSRRKLVHPNLTPLIDVLFILIIFFMLTTSYMRVESLELMLPSASGKSSPSKDVVHLYLHAGGEMTLGQRKVDNAELDASLSRLVQRDPNTRIMLLTADGVTLQQMVEVMDRITLAGGKGLYVRKWQQGG